MKKRSAMLGVRIPEDLRAAIEAEAAREDVPMSQIAVRWMRLGRERAQPAPRRPLHIPAGLPMVHTVSGAVMNPAETLKWRLGSVFDRNNDE